MKKQVDKREKLLRIYSILTKEKVYELIGLSYKALYNRIGMIYEDKKSGAGLIIKTRGELLHKFPNINMVKLKFNREYFKSTEI